MTRVAESSDVTTMHALDPSRRRATTAELGITDGASLPPALRPIYEQRYIGLVAHSRSDMELQLCELAAMQATSRGLAHVSSGQAAGSPSAQDGSLLQVEAAGGRGGSMQVEAN